MTPTDRTEWLLTTAAALLAVGAVLMGQGSGLAWFAALPCLAFGAACIAWHRSPDESMAGVVLLAAGFVRLMMGPIGVGALLLVPVVGLRADPEARHLVAAAAGVHLAVFAAHQLAVAIGEPFPALTTVSPGEALGGLALFLPFTLLGHEPA